MASTVQSIKEKLQNNILKDNRFIDDKLNLSSLDSPKNLIATEIRPFSHSPLNIKQCCETLVRIHYLQLFGEKFTEHESSEIFFSITKLFQSRDMRLRRLVYSTIQSFQVKDSEVFILTSSLTKDMNTGNDPCRANALRTFSKIADPSMATQIERYIKTAIVDNNPFVSSAALTCGIHLSKVAPEVIKRWGNEITECLSSKHQMVQFHALILLYELKQMDKLTLQKIIIALINKSQKSQFTECMIMKYSVNLLNYDTDTSSRNTLLTNLEKNLSLSNDVLRLESAKSFVLLAMKFRNSLNNTILFDYDLSPAILSLREFLSSHKSPIRFSAIKQINLMSQYCPSLVVNCNMEVERLLNDSNRNIASLALTTLLKNGNEENIERLITQITFFMKDGSDSLKQEVIKAVQTMCLTFPSKHSLLMSVLSRCLKEEGSFEYKNEAIKGIITLIETVPEALESGLNYLCDFIEDCEFPSLCMLILSLLGEHVPRTESPSKYIRFIYNRLILESAQLRAAGVDSLAKISLKCPELKKDIILLLESCSTDNDDEVRDRTNLYCKAMNSSFVKINEEYQENGGEDSLSTSSPSLDSFLSVENDFSLDNFCDMLHEHIQTSNSTAFDTELLSKENQINVSSNLQEKEITNKASSEFYDPHLISITTNSTRNIIDQEFMSKTESCESEIFEALSSLVSSSLLGRLLFSTTFQPLTEKEAEIYVTVRKFFFSHYLVLELNVNNTLPNETFYRVEPVLTSFDIHLWEFIGSASISKLEREAPQSCYILLQYVNSISHTMGTKAINLYIKYDYYENIIGSSDEYTVEPISFRISDYLAPSNIPRGQFIFYWESLSNAFEVIGKYSLNFKSLDDAVNGLIDSLNLSPCDGSNIVDAKALTHKLALAGSFLNQTKVLCIASLFMDEKHGCILKFTSRSENQEICYAILDSFE